jgi:glycosyltransferase involved in cell wall biosynthesis
MISVVIPVYNCSCVVLVETLHKQLIASAVVFELICLDDASDIFTSENLTIANLSHTTYNISKTNLGRIATRQHLANMANYDWLIFLDADVLPKSEQFIQTYLNVLNTESVVVYGGFAYYEELPEKNYRLRWRYGKAKEQVLAAIRNKTPYKVVISANFLIKKPVFLNVTSKIDGKAYGNDNYFGAILKAEHINVLHIDNEVYHLGLDTNADYLRKKEQAAETLVTLLNSGSISEHDNGLLKLFQQLKYFKLHYLFQLFYMCFESLMKKNLLGGSPNIQLLQLYRISYMCYFDLKNK